MKFFHPLLAVGATILAMTGCASSVNQSAFTTFQSSISSTKTTSESMTTTFVANAGTIHIEALAASDVAQDECVVLTPSAGDVTVSDEDTSEAAFQALLDGVVRYNNTMLKYAQLLNQLADPTIVGTATLDSNATTMASDSAKVLSDLQSTLHLKSVTDAQKVTGIVSSAFTEVIEIYLADKQASALAQAIKNNQGNVEQYSKVGQELVDLCLTQIPQKYAMDHDAVIAAFVNVVNARVKPNKPIDPIDYKGAWASATVSERVSYLQSEYSLESNVRAQIQTLNSLYKVYGALPKAHSDLANSIKSPKADLTGLNELYSEAQHLVQLYNSSQKAASTPSSATTATKT